MPRIVPSQVIDLIDRVFPNAKDQIDSNNNKFSIGREYSGSLRTIIDLVEQIPPELLVLPADKYNKFISAINSIKGEVDKWKSHDSVLTKVPGFGNLNPITIVRLTLAECPDEFPSTKPGQLKFIRDKNFRKTLELDISAINIALANNEWKATNVLAGSFIEALLLWKLEEIETKDKKKAIQSLLLKETFKKDPGNKLENWSLFHYIEVAHILKIITSETANQARLAKDFRNLIHPGRQIRKNQRCDRGTALAAVAAVEFVIKDLSR